MEFYTRLGYFVVVLAVALSLLRLQQPESLLNAVGPALTWSMQHLSNWVAKVDSNASEVVSLDASLQSQPSQSVQDDGEPAACELHGKVIDCACGYGEVERLNRDVLWPTLEELVSTPFFRHFKVNLYCDCPLWPDEGQCFKEDCCVKECQPPQPWAEADTKRKEQLCQGEGGVDRAVSSGMVKKLDAIGNWHGLNNPWVPEDDADMDYVYIDLKSNPERYTGYTGDDARRVWGAIYDQSCFEDIARPDTCKEVQVFFRLISGMHSSITTHIIQDFYDEVSATWGPNMKLFKLKFGNKAARQYVENLYFSFLFVLRALMKIRTTLEGFDYNTGTASADARTRELVNTLVNNPQLQEACPSPFDEGLLWKREDSAQLREQLQVHFQNITKIMDCVGCEKCKMWGKLQILGIASSLKILFTEHRAEHVELDRNEVIALVNLLSRLSESIETVRKLSLRLKQEESLATAKAKDGYGAIQQIVDDKK